MAAHRRRRTADRAPNATGARCAPNGPSVFRSSTIRCPSGKAFSAAHRGHGLDVVDGAWQSARPTRPTNNLAGPETGEQPAPSETSWARAASQRRVGPPVARSRPCWPSAVHRDAVQGLPLRQVLEAYSRPGAKDCGSSRCRRRAADQDAAATQPSTWPRSLLDVRVVPIRGVPWIVAGGSVGSPARPTSPRSGILASDRTRSAATEHRSP